MQKNQRAKRHMAAAVLEVLETRTLFSAYALSTVAQFNGTNGADPFMTSLVMDAHGNLFGTTQGGGAGQCGTVFEIVAGTSTITTLASFDGNNGSGPWGDLVVDAAGNIYGVTGGSNNDMGTVFVIPHGTHNVGTIATFPQDLSEGGAPIGLVMDGAGNLFGVTQMGGANSDGTVFEIVKGSGTITTVATFDGTNGSIPEGGLLVDSNGNLFGTTERGGAQNNGTVFEIAAGSNTVTTLVSFTGSTGQSPMGDLIMDGQGNLYGMTQFGGDFFAGTIYKVTAGSNTLTTLASFDADTGDDPFSGLVMDSNGNLFGGTVSGGAGGNGTIFELPAGSSTINVLASLVGSDGENAAGSLVLDANGVLWGEAMHGGDANSDGLVFKLTPTQSTQLAFTQQPTKTVVNQTLSEIDVAIKDAQGRIVNSDNSAVTLSIASGNGTLLGTLTVNAVNGVAMFSDLSIDTSGYYTLTASAGPLSAATSQAFSVVPSAISALASFDNTIGDTSLGGVVIDAQGNLFGVTSEGGAHNAGAVYELVKGASALTVIASFDNNNGGAPVGGLIIDSSGNLFGLNQGSVYEVVHGSNTISTLAAISIFDNPSGHLVMDSSGNLFGVTITGGAHNDGYIFELPSGSQTISTLASFNNSNWTFRPEGLVLDGAGNLYGATFLNGASGLGGIFTLAHGSHTITQLASFNGDNGEMPQGLFMDAGGNLYGVAVTTNHGGSNIFMIPAGTGTISVIASTMSTSTQQLVMDAHGNLFGTSLDGVFEIASGSGTITPLVSFNNGTGSSPMNLVIDAAGNIFGVTSTGAANGTGSVFLFQNAPASALTIAAGPSSATAGQNLQSIVVHVVDADGYVVTSDDSTVTLTLHSNGSVISTVSAIAHNGVATFSGLSLQTAGSYIVVAANGELPLATSNLTINPAAASQLVFTSQPADATAGALDMVTVAVEDQYGNILTSNSSNVTVSLASGNGTLLGTLTVAAVNGVATFSDLGIHTAGTFTLGAIDGVIPSATSSSFAITPAAATQLAFIQQPVDATSGPLNTITLAVEDAYGNVVTSDHSNVTVSVASGGGTLGGTLTVAASNGIATFNTLTLHAAGPHTLSASDGSLSSATSDVFSITPIAPAVNSTKLVFTQQPVAITAGNTLSNITVSIEDALGHVVASDNSEVTISIATGPDGATLLGTATVQAQNGIAVFTDLSLQTAGAYMLIASDTTLAAANSSRFTVNPAAASHVTFQHGPSDTTAGNNIPVSVMLTDAFGNTVTTNHSSATLSILSGPGGAQLRGSLTASVANGVATFRNISLTKAGTYTLRATDGGLTVDSGTFTISTAGATKLVFTQQPTNAGVGAILAPAMTVAVEDAFGNVVTTNMSTITLSIATGAKAALGGVVVAPVQNGVAQFNAVSFSAAGTYKLKATNGTLTTTSGTLTIGGGLSLHRGRAGLML